MKPFLTLNGKTHRITVHREGNRNDLTVWKEGKRVKWFTCGEYPCREAHKLMRELEPEFV